MRNYWYEKPIRRDIETSGWDDCGCIEEETAPVRLPQSNIRAVL
jgi:hypothetical protein